MLGVFCPVEQLLLEHPSCLFLHARQDMTVYLQREGRRTMAEAFLHDLDIHALSEKQRGVAVPQIMEPNSRQALWQRVFGYALPAEFRAQLLQRHDAAEVAPA